MKKRIIILLITLLIGFFLFLVFKNYYPQKKSISRDIPAPAEIVITRPPEFQDFEFQLQEATSTINIFWDETKIEIFHLVLVDTDKLLQNKEESAVWAISSLKLNKPFAMSIKKKEVPAFLSSSYAVGEKRNGFYSNGFGTGIVDLEQKREYYLQMIGFDKEGNLKAAAKTFIFGQK